VDTTLKDFAFGVRTLRKNPAFAITALITLALGIGASTAIFSVVNGVLLRPLPYTNADRLVLITSEDSGEAGRGPGPGERFARRVGTLWPAGISRSGNAAAQGVLSTRKMS
jgi:hypothetical protein